MTPIRVATNTALPPIKVKFPQGIALTPDGRTAYVTNGTRNTLTPIRTATNTALPPIKVGAIAGEIAITPDGSTAYVAAYGGYSVTPVDLAIGMALPRIKHAGSGAVNIVFATRVAAQGG